MQKNLFSIGNKPGILRKSSLFVTMLCLLAGTLAAQTDYYSYSLSNFREAEPFLESIDIHNPDTERINAVVFYLTNEIRHQQKLNVLKYNSRLEKSASIHSESMVKYDFFSHTNSKKKSLKTPEDRAKAAGITNPMLAENLIQAFMVRYEANKPVIPLGNGVFRYPNQKEAIPLHTYLSMGDKMLKDWMNSPGHKANIINPNALELGCGTAVYPLKSDNDFPTVATTQNFQLYEACLIDE